MEDEYDEEGGEGMDSSDEDHDYGDEEQMYQSANNYASNAHITP